MSEYEASGDMTEVSAEKIESDLPTYYLPQHVVLKPDSTTTKIRVVFDGSSKTSSVLSLNEVQHVGPTVQGDPISIVLRFRKHKIVLSADVAKMYRCIYVDEEQRRLQRILWRTDNSEPLQIYELNTVTYGMAAASYLVTRCLRQLGEENKEEHSTASKVIISDFYVEDLLTGADSLDEARALKDELTSILEPAGLSLRKWVSNDERVFN
ncbi:uncharacterized protein LOC117178654 [Belonocnema kinseyi]|uniref:uncharacterized protein LOC117178654 n=1 Tax=Belonocnema kinseyi TaxID=2817044 RepID=UPI00143D2D5E|nr:uncharacterized protein LOC117178654 [Belonocnema kinseyi]